jgi:uncharacterized membrane protein YeaQ/YmgE (transglycosylase-associated protein family)
MRGFILSMIVVGLIAGALARFLVPGRDPMSVGNTMVLGIIGSFLGGFVGSLVHGGGLQFGPAGMIGSVIGSIIALLIYRSMGKPISR